MKTTYSDITNALKIMHYNYGIGDIKEIRLFADGRIEIIAKGFNMKPHKRTGRMLPTKRAYTQTIKIYGHQRTVTIY